MESSLQRLRPIKKMTADGFVDSAWKLRQRISLRRDATTVLVVPRRGKRTRLLVPLDNKFQQFHFVLILKQQLDRSLKRFCSAARH